jgi:hypothetical protein
LWGEVVECERGFRASHAYPLRLYLPVDCTAEDRDDVAHALGSYGVPVELLSAACSRAVRELKAATGSSTSRRRGSHPRAAL